LGLRPRNDDFFYLVVRLYDLNQREFVREFFFQGWTKPGVMANAPVLPPADLIKTAAANMATLEYVRAIGDGSSVYLRASPPEPLTLCIGLGDPVRPATAADLEQLKALTKETLATLAAAVDAHTCLPQEP
jgi:hypothetical protein